MKTFGKIIAMCFLSIFVVSYYVLADEDLDPIDFSIIPELKPEEIADINAKIEEIGATSGGVWNKYNEIAASSGFTTSKQVASGIMNWDTIMNYLVFVVQFLSQLGLVVGVMFIMYAGYKYMASVFSGGRDHNAGTTVKNAIIGVIIVIFSYAILKTLTSLIGIS